MKTGRPRLTFFRERFAELVATGSTVEAAAKAVRIHRATAYRWCDQMGLHRRPYRRAATAKK
jgi:transposase